MEIDSAVYGNVFNWIIALGYILANGAAFGITYARYFYDPAFYYTRLLTSGNLPLARGAAACINLNAALVILPACRNLVSLCRQLAPFPLVKKSLDANIKAHKIIAYALMAWSLVHILSHYLNIYALSYSWVRWTYTELHRRLFGDFRLNQIGPSFNLVAVGLRLQAGWSGCLLVLILLLMRTAAAEPIKRSFHELFIRTHHAFVAFYPLMWYHGSGGLIKRQINLDRHDPLQCADQYAEWDVPGGACVAPQFAAMASTSHWWMLVSILAYLAELTLRCVHWANPAHVETFTMHPSNVLELRLRKKYSIRGNAHEVGQYIQIKINVASKWEWHPFTLTSAPEDGFFMVHIRQSGDWTRRVQTIFRQCHALNQKPPRVAIEGPFGTSSQDVFDYETVVCCGAGIGITPFASFLRSLLYLHRANVRVKINKVHFIWICKTTSAFEWFQELLRNPGLTYM